MFNADAKGFKYIQGKYSNVNKNTVQRLHCLFDFLSPEGFRPIVPHFLMVAHQKI